MRGAEDVVNEKSLSSEEPFIPTGTFRIDNYCEVIIVPVILTPNEIKLQVRIFIKAPLPSTIPLQEGIFMFLNYAHIPQVSNIDILVKRRNWNILFALNKKFLR